MRISHDTTYCRGLRGAELCQHCARFLNPETVNATLYWMPPALNTKGCPNYVENKDTRINGRI